MTDDIEALLFEYLELVAAGSPPTFDNWVDDYPEQATELREAWSDYGRAIEELSSTRAVPGHSERLEPGTTIGEFTLVRQLGQGGQGSVWEAEQPDLGRHVALKVLAPGRVSEADLGRFRREALAGARLQHSGIVAVHAAGQSDGISWIAQELVPGGRTLRHLVDEVRNAPELPPDWYRTCGEIARLIALALAEAHGAGIVHRDLKPQNILLTQEGSPKVGDFGLARIDDSTSFSVTGQVLGTYFYMSPEQLSGRQEQITPRVDVFCLGVVLYELITLQRPFQGDTAHQICMQILQWDPPDPRELRTQVPRDLAVIALAAIEKDPQRRYQSMEALAEDLRRFLAAEPIRARPTSAARRLAKWSKRHPVRSAVAGVASVAFAVISWALVELVRARNEATGEASRANAAMQNARARQEELGGLLDELLYNVHYRLDDLAGSSQAQELITQTALSYIESLEQAGDDGPELRLRLAIARMRVGEIQSGIVKHGVGDTEAGLAHFEQAVEILRELRATLPESSSLASQAIEALGLALIDVAHCHFQMNRPAAGLPPVREALEIWKAVDAEGEPDEEQLDNRLRGTQVLSALLSATGEVQQATEASLRVLAMARTLFARFGQTARLVKAADYAAVDLVQRGRVGEARSILDSISEIVAAPEWKADQSLAARYHRASHDHDMGIVLRHEGRGLEALDSFQSAARQYRELCQLDAADQNAVESVLQTLGEIALTGMAEGLDESQDREYRRAMLHAALSACQESEAIRSSSGDRLARRWQTHEVAISTYPQIIEDALGRL